MISVQLAKHMMQFQEVLPQPPGEEISELQEIFYHPRFTEGSKEEKRAMMHASALAKYKSEMEYPWDHYFILPWSAAELHSRR